MALKATVTNLDSVAEEHHGLYVEQEAGGFRLDVEGVEFPEDVQGLKNTVKKLRETAATEAREKAEALKELEKLKAEAQDTDDEDGKTAEKGAEKGADKQERRIQRLAQEHEQEVKAKQAEIDRLTAENHQHIVGSLFEASELFTGAEPKTFFTPRAAKALYGKHFKIEDGKPVGYYDEQHTDPILDSKSGRPAEGRAALVALLDADPEKDSIFRGSGASGSNAPANGHSPRNSSEDTSKLPPVVRLQGVFDKTTVAS